MKAQQLLNKDYTRYLASIIKVPDKEMYVNQIHMVCGYPIFFTYFPFDREKEFFIKLVRDTISTFL